MSPTEDEARLLDSSTEFASTHPPLSPLKINQPYTRPRSNPLNLHAGSHRISAELTGPPSPSVSSGSGLIPDLGTNPASSLWPQVERKFYLRHSSTLSSFTSSGSKPNSGADAEEHVDLPPISPSRKYVPFEPLPSVIPQRPRSPSPPVPPTLLTSPTLPQRTGSGRNRLVLRPATVNWGGFDSGFPARPPDQNKRNNKQIVWKTILKAGLPVYLDTPGFDAFTLCPSASGTYCSPTALLAAFSDTDVFYHLYAAGQKLSRNDLIPSKCTYEGGIIQHATDVVLAEYGAALIEQNAGQHFTFVNVKQDTTADTIVQRSRGLVQCFEKNGITKDKIVVSIPATEQGVHATRLLAKEDGILVNLAMVAGMPHAAVCAEAGAAWITFHLGKLEKVYEDLGEPSQGIKAIQSTIALFDMHNIETKIMISGLRDIRKIAEFPGAHGFSITKEQIVSARITTSRLCRIPPQSASFLPEDATNQARGAKWPPRFFDVAPVGGSNGNFVRCFPSRLQTVMMSIQRDLFCHTGKAIRDFLALIRDDVVGYRILMRQLLNPRTGTRALAYEGVGTLSRIVNSKKDLRSAEVEWRSTITGRILPKVQWEPTIVNKCEAWITPEGRIEALIPAQWDRRMVASMDIEADY